jgi:hypothetical protein
MVFANILQQVSDALTGLIPAPFSDLIGQVFAAIIGLLGNLPF